MPAHGLDDQPVGAHAMRLGEEPDGPTRRVVIARGDEVPERGRVVVAAGGTELAVFRIDGQLYALENYCAHYGGPVCQGRIINRVLEVLDSDKRSLGMRFSDDEIHVVCPWHGYEFNIRTGESAAKPNIRLRSFPVVETDGDIVVEL